MHVTRELVRARGALHGHGASDGWLGRAGVTLVFAASLEGSYLWARPHSDSLLETREAARGTFHQEGHRSSEDRTSRLKMRLSHHRSGLYRAIDPTELCQNPKVQCRPIVCTLHKYASFNVTCTGKLLRRCARYYQPAVLAIAGTTAGRRRLSTNSGVMDLASSSRVGIIAPNLAMHPSKHRHAS